MYPDKKQKARAKLRDKKCTNQALGRKGSTKNVPDKKQKARTRPKLRAKR